MRSQGSCVELAGILLLTTGENRESKGAGAIKDQTEGGQETADKMGDMGLGCSEPEHD